MAGGCVVGLFFLLKERWVVWKPALKWALFIAFLQALVVLNQWPLLWMGYDTAISSTTFALQQIAVALAQLVGMGSVLALSFIAAESLGRRAFPRHIQLWKTWSGEVAPTTSMLGQTVAGYLLIGIFFAYEVWLYLFTARHFDWWSPSSALTDPDVLANIFPWLTSVAISLQAGFWEECLFRAVPLAAAALLGKKIRQTVVVDHRGHDPAGGHLRRRPRQLPGAAGLRPCGGVDHPGPRFRRALPALRSGPCNRLPLRVRRRVVRHAPLCRRHTRDLDQPRAGHRPHPDPTLGGFAGEVAGRCMGRGPCRRLQRSLGAAARSRADRARR